MVDDAQTTNTTQAGSSPTTGSALQPLAQTGLQPQSTNTLQTPEASNLQPTSNQTINSINQLDQGTSSIKLSSISLATTATAQTTTPPPPSHKSALLYGGVGIIVAGIMAVMVYRLLRPQ